LNTEARITLPRQLREADVSVRHFFFLTSALVCVIARADDSKIETTVQRTTHVCAACHNPSQERTQAAIPTIAGQMPLYISAQLKDFRTQKRAESDTQAYMWGISALLDDAVIDGLAEYFASQTPEPGVPGDATLVSSGRKIYEQGIPERNVRACAGCHGSNAEGASVFPRLAGQNAEYIYRELKIFSTRLRPHGVLMKNEAAGLSENDMRAVAQYVQSR
jgi:cytochrome c553